MITATLFVSGIFLFGHVGGDDAYGPVDQPVVVDSFRLVKK